MCDAAKRKLRLTSAMLMSSTTSKEKVGLKSTSSLPFSGWKSHHTTQDLSIVLSF
jgi:hypothetical protein